MKLKEALEKDMNIVYRIDYRIRNRQVCKTATLKEFLRELTEYSFNDIAVIIKNAVFRKF